MKKLFLLIIIGFLFKPMLGQDTIPNGHLESWYHVADSSHTYDYWNPAGGFLKTLDTLATIPPDLQGPGPVTAERITDSHSGYAAKLTTKLFLVGSLPILIPGALGTITLHLPNTNVNIGVPYTFSKPPMNITGWAKYQPVSGDSASVVLLVSKWNPGKNVKDTLMFGKIVLHTMDAAYKEFTVPMTYYDLVTKPDTVTFLACSSAGFNVLNLFGSVGQINSTLYIDDIVLALTNGIQEVLLPKIGVKTFPNPVKDFLNIELSEDIKEGTLFIYSERGEYLTSFSLKGINNSFPVNYFANGLYFYKLMKNNHALNSGSFIIQR